jgi:alpha-L-fucosidase
VLNVWLGMPELTPHIMAYYYNANIRRNKGELDAVFNIKNVPTAVLSTLVRDFEMRQADVLEANPWQTDACIGGWHYSKTDLGKSRIPDGSVDGSPPG